MIGRADIEGSKRNIIKNTQLQQASYPCGNFIQRHHGPTLAKSSFFKTHYSTKIEL